MKLSTSLLVGGCLALLGGPAIVEAAPKKAAQQSSISSKFFADAERYVRNARRDELIPFYVVLADQATREEVDRLAGIDNADVRHQRVMNLLQSVANRSQGRVLSLLNNATTSGQARNVFSLWITNAVAGEATPDVILALANDPSVAQVVHDVKRNILIEPIKGDETDDDVNQFTPTCGLNLIGAPQVWSQFNITGRGSVIAVIDTGVCITHSDIRNQMWVNRGETPSNGRDDDGNGFVDDINGWNFTRNNNNVGDNNGHGSHCAGTVAGDGTNGTTCGVAPDAEIMVPRSDLQISGEAEIWNAIQYASRMRARAMSMSFGWIYQWNPNRRQHRDVNLNAMALGTLPVVAAGNEGNSFGAPRNIRTPGDVPEVLTIGAVDCSDRIASFSSIGPVSWTGITGYDDWPFPPGHIKPDVTAPGVNTRSHNTCNGYFELSGTSMATPHTAGLVALMVEANRNLRPEQIKEILQATSRDLGATGKDNTFGAGRIQAVNAVQEAINQRNRVYPEAYSVIRGTRTSRDRIQDSYINDDTYLSIRTIASASINVAGAEVEYSGTARSATASSIEVRVENGSSATNVDARIQLFDFQSNSWVTVDTRRATSGDTSYLVAVTNNASRFVGPNSQIRTRVGFLDRGAPSAAWTGRVDSFSWTVNP